MKYHFQEKYIEKKLGNSDDSNVKFSFKMNLTIFVRNPLTV